MAVRYFALAVGVIYLLVGAMGFVPALYTAPPADAPDLAVDAGYGLLMGLFPINVLHNVVHLAIGLWGVASYPRFDASRWFARGLTIVYGLLAVMGLFPALRTTFGLVPIFGHDIWLHAVTAVAAAYFGWMYERVEAPRRGRAF